MYNEAFVSNDEKPSLNIQRSLSSSSRDNSTKEMGSSNGSMVGLSKAWTVPSEQEEPSHEHVMNVMEPKESRLSFVIQTFFPFLLAGIGMVAAGLLLDNAAEWYFLSTVKEAMIMVPALLGLKGNLEMTLASRLSTQANIGKMDSRRQQISALVSNVALVQAQAIVVSTAASILTLCTSMAEGQAFVWRHFISLTLTAVLTASVASFLLSTTMVLLAIACRKCNMNPDNICTPIAAMLGDVTTLGFLILLGTWFTQSRETMYILQTAVLVLFLCSTVIWIIIASKNETTLEVLKHGWYIILVAMMISSCGGYVLKFAAHRFPQLVVFQPVVNGVGGNLVAVQASKISTSLHRYGKLGQLPVNSLLTYLNPFRTFLLREEESYHAWFLLLMSIPGHTIFLVIIFMVVVGSLFSYIFYVSYIVAALIQVAILLYICQFVCRLLWRFKINPDNNAIPFLTSLGDLLGTSLLTVMFIVLTAFSAENLVIVGKEKMP